MSFYSDYPVQNGGSGGVITLNGLSGALTLVAGSGITITPSGSNITIASTGGGGGANTTLSNLDTPTAINQDLLSLDNTQNIGSLSTPNWFASIVSNTFQVVDSSGAQLGHFNSNTGVLQLSSISGTQFTINGDGAGLSLNALTAGDLNLNASAGNVNLSGLAIVLNAPIIFNEFITGVIQTFDESGGNNSAQLTIKSGNTDSGDNSGNLILQSGFGTNCPSGQVQIFSGDTTGGTNSGQVNIRTGNVDTAGDSGRLNLFTGDGFDSDTGIMFLNTGNTSGSGNSAGMFLQSGNASGSGNSGSINISTGTINSGTRGDILFDSNNLQVNGNPGASGTFTTVDSKTITVLNGIIISIV